MHLYRALGGGWEMRCEGVFDAPIEVADNGESIPTNPEQVSPGAPSLAKPGPVIGPSQGQTAPKKPGPESLPNPLPQYQQQPGAPRKTLPGPSDMAPPAASGAKVNRPSTHSIASQSMTAQSAPAQSVVTRSGSNRNQSSSHIQDVTAQSKPTNDSAAKISQKLIRSNEEASFDWSEVDRSMTSPKTLSNPAANLRHRDRNDGNEPTTPIPGRFDQAADESEQISRPLQHAGMLPEDKGEIQWQR